MKYQIKISDRETNEFIGFMNSYPCCRSVPMTFSSMTEAKKLAAKETAVSLDAIYEACEAQ